MSIEVKVPQLPESVADATLVAWHKKPGEAVARDENLVDLETDKVVLEVPAPSNGTLSEIKAEEGAVVTSGDLLEARRKHGIDGVAIARIEQFYPFPIDEYAALIGKYSGARDIIWCQEEPQNQGAWYQIRHRLQEPLTDAHALYYAGRAGAAAPASGIYQMHQQQQVSLVDAALGVEDVANLIEDTAIRKKA